MYKIHIHTRSRAQYGGAWQSFVVYCKHYKGERDRALFFIYYLLRVAGVALGPQIRCLYIQYTLIQYAEGILRDEMPIERGAGTIMGIRVHRRL